MNSRTCTVCGQLKPPSEFYRNKKHKHGFQYSCKECDKARVTIWYRENKERADANRKRSRLNLRKQILAAYGNQCACCGEDTPEFLTVDHIHNDGCKHRRELGAQSFYSWLRREGFPKDRFQLLCYNCNMAKAQYGRCPHEDHRR